MNIWKTIAVLAKANDSDAVRSFVNEVEEADGGPGSGNWGHAGRPGKRGGSGISDATEVKNTHPDTEKTIASLTPNGGYTEKPEYKHSVERFVEAMRKKDSLDSELNKLNQKIDKECAILPKDQWDDSTREDYEMLGYELSDALGIIPRKNPELYASLKAEKEALAKEQLENEHVISEETDKRREMDWKAHREGYVDFTSQYNRKPDEATQSEYAGFEKETGVPYYDDLMDNGEGYVAEMSPEEYLKRCAYQIFDRGTMESQLRALDKENVQKYADMMADGEKFDMPYLNFKEKQQEGRHRALAALSCGIEKIPCFIVPSNEMANDEMIDDGGPGSGNFGHKGRKGQRGGSAKRGEGGNGGETISKQAKSAAKSANQQKFSGSVSRAFGRLNAGVHIKQGGDIYKRLDDGKWESQTTGEVVSANELADKVDIDNEETYPSLATAEEIESISTKEPENYLDKMSDDDKNHLRRMLRKVGVDMDGFTGEKTYDELTKELTADGYANRSKMYYYGMMTQMKLNATGEDLGELAKKNLTKEEYKQYLGCLDKARDQGNAIYNNDDIINIAKMTIGGSQWTDEYNAQKLMSLISKANGGPEIPITASDPMGAFNSAQQARAAGQPVRDYNSKIATGLGKDHYDMVSSLVDDCGNAKIQKVWDGFSNTVEVADAIASFQYNEGGNSRIHVNVAKNAAGDSIHFPGETTIHESAHAMDTEIGKKAGMRGLFSAGYKNGLFQKTLQQEVNDRVDKIGQDKISFLRSKDGAFYAEYVYDEYTCQKEFGISQRDAVSFAKTGKMSNGRTYKPTVAFLRQALVDGIKKEKYEKITTSCLSDILQATTGIKYPLGVGHKGAYFKGFASKELAHEAFAEFYASSVCAVSSRMEVIKKYLPKSYAVFEEMLDAVPNYIGK